MAQALIRKGTDKAQLIFSTKKRGPISKDSVNNVKFRQHLNLRLLFAELVRKFLCGSLMR